LASLTIRNVDNKLVSKLKLRAARNGRSMEAELRDMLQRMLDAEPSEDFWTLAAKVREMTADRRLTPSEDLVREGRDER
jgi:antitoxin FitA